MFKIQDMIIINTQYSMCLFSSYLNTNQKLLTIFIKKKNKYKFYLFITDNLHFLISVFTIENKIIIKHVLNYLVKILIIILLTKFYIFDIINLMVSIKLFTISKLITKK